MKYFLMFVGFLVVGAATMFVQMLWDQGTIQLEWATQKARVLMAVCMAADKASRKLERVAYGCATKAVKITTSAVERYKAR